MSIELRRFTDDEVVNPLPKETAETVALFLEEHQETIIKWCNWMGAHEEHPLNKVVPFLHCRQIGIEANIVISMENSARPGLIINPEFVVLDKKAVAKGFEVSESFMVEGKEHVKRVFLAERSESILLKYSDYTDKETKMLPDSESYEGEYAILLQEAVDFSNGKLITRFTEVVDEEVAADTIEGEVIGE